MLENKGPNKQAHERSVTAKEKQIRRGDRYLQTTSAPTTSSKELHHPGLKMFAPLDRAFPEL